jgi:hypothetical protein
MIIKELETQKNLKTKIFGWEKLKTENLIFVISDRNIRKTILLNWEYRNFEN